MVFDAASFLFNPTSRFFEYFDHFRFFCVLVLVPEFTAVFPPRLWRHAYQDVLGSDAGRSEPKFGASVDDEIEFDGTTAPEELPPSLGRDDWGMHMPLQDGYERGQKTVPKGLDEVEQGFLSAQPRNGVLGRAPEQRTHRVGVHIVEPDTTDPAVFVSMWDVEVVVTRGFEGRVDGEGGIAPCVTRPLEGGVKVCKVGHVEVGGCEVGDDAEPPREDSGRCCGGLGGVVVGRRSLRECCIEDFKVAVVGVGRRDTGVAGVENKTEANCEKGKRGVNVFECCVGGAHLFDGGRWEDAAHLGDVDARFFDGSDGRSVKGREGAGEAATAFIPGPCLASK